MVRLFLYSLSLEEFEKTDLKKASASPDQDRSWP